jgi:hypothetical protein
MNLTPEPATQKQLDYMASLGISIPADCTKKKASALIKKHVDAREQERDKAKNPVREAVYLEKFGPDFEIKKIVRNFPFWKLHVDVLVAEAKKDGRREAKEARSYLWKFTFSGDSIDGDERVIEVVFYGDEVMSPEVLKMTQEYGLAMEEPNITTIKKLLEELDAENQTWDRDNPALFYQRLALVDGGKYRTRRSSRGTSGPQQRAARRQTAKKGGCVGMLLSAVLLAAVAFAVLLRG